MLLADQEKDKEITQNWTMVCLLAIKKKILKFGDKAPLNGLFF